MTEAEIRVLITDKIDPIRNDIQEIKETTNKLFDLYLKDHGKNKKSKDSDS